MRITLEPLELERDLAVLHTWVTHPRAAFWMMQGASVEDVRAEYGRIVADPSHDAWLGRVDGVPAFLAETYDPARSDLAKHLDGRAGDLGMHVLVAPTDVPRHGFTAAVFGAVMRHCLADPAVRRVVVEPDVRNDAIRAMNARAGFVVEREVELPGKRAALSTCTREQWLASPLAGAAPPAAPDLADHLEPLAMERAQRRLVAKALGELAHERLLVPEPVGDDHVVRSGRSTWRFHAHRHELDHWVVAPWSVARELDGRAADPDVLDLVAELHTDLGIPEALLATYLEELSATLAAAAWKDHHERLDSRALLHADLPDVEAAMTEGHPAFIANNGRIGFGLDDYRAYAPETGSDVRLFWVAVRRDLAVLALGEGLEEESFLAGELDADVLAGFRARLEGLGLDPADHVLVPTHPWQWRNKLAVTFAPDVARRDVVPLGEGPDAYRAQQSIRTFYDVSRPERHYVKTALSIQNMGFMRGLSPHYMAATPAINDWVARLVADDPELEKAGFEVLRERVAVGYTGGVYQRLPGRSAYQKMLSALWRESPAGRLRPGERAATMASLLHRDRAGTSHAVELVRASGLDPADWLRRYLDAYLRPVAHCLWAHDLVFMPHGENVILVLADHVPVRVLMKDVGEEVAVVGDRTPLPAEVARIRADVPEDVRALSVLTDVVDGFLRFLAADLAEDGVLPAADFWATAAACLRDLQADHPDLADVHARYDLFAPEFAHSCLNRLQLRNTLEMVDLADQAASLVFAGTLSNPLAVHERGR